MSERYFVLSSWDEFAHSPDLIAFLVEPVRRLSYVYDRLKLCRSVMDRLPDKVVNAGSRLLCGDSDWTLWLRRRLAGRPSKYEPDFIGGMRPLRMDQIGYVYFVKSPLRPSSLKIGFTTRIPEVRVRGLMANAGEPLDLIGAFAGTLMDEQILHFMNEPAKVAGEWYFKPPLLPDVPFLHRELQEAA